MGCHIRAEEDTPEQAILRRYFRIARLHRALLEKNLNFAGIYQGQHRILMCISDHPNISQKDLAGMHEVTTAAMAVSLRKLEEEGYIFRAVDERDKRFNQILITEKGENVVRRSRGIFKEIEKKMFEGFSDDEFAALSGLLDKVLRNLDPITISESEAL